ncbi:leukocyte elastase inhibitor-like isoform X2 [Penaeus chinensis]|uniref:leukocyte elastase inhibitor-like isoform X2 n=1 Tax=Penaeus chinensis TaxID=139456 RepID=UPI001FB5D8A3|nr:leukocyte elastase inhibitor-like isoform X2 [Penaeus chinensis]
MPCVIGLWCFLYRIMKVAAVLSVLAFSAQTDAQCITENDLYVPKTPPNLNSVTPFSTRLLKDVLPSSENFFFSPFSVWMALVLTYFGSKGNTEKQLQTVLAVSDKTEALGTYRSLTRLYSTSEDKEYTLNTANRIYVDQSLPLNECLREALSGDVKNINFAQPDLAATAINAYVDHATQGMIPQLVDPSDVTESAMAFVNAVYFKGFWKHPFKTENTKKGKFFVSPVRHEFVDMMKQAERFRYGESKALNAKVLEMPYRGKTTSMYVFLPKNMETGHEVDDMVKGITPEILQTAMKDEINTENVVVQIPKFKSESTLRDSLKMALIRMGLGDLFSPAADLTGFSSAGGLRITNGVHKAVIEVNEEGAEAAAATALVSGRSSRLEEIKYFICDRPFFYFIRDNSSENILFMGIYRKP